MLLLLSSLIALAFLVLYYKWSQARRYWADLGVPNDPPSPLYGSLNFVMKMNGLNFFVNQYKKYEGSPYFGIWLFWRPVLMIRDPDIAKRILVKDFHLFRDRLATAGKHDKLAHTNLFFANDPIWSATRKSISPIFTSAKLRTLQNLYSEKSKDLVTRITNDKKMGNKIELRELFADYMTSLLASIVFGVADEAVLNRDSPLRKIIKNLIHFSWWRACSWACLFWFPEISGIFGFTFAPKDCTEYLKMYFKKALEQKVKWTEGSEVRDLLDILMEIKRNSKDDEETTENHLLSQALVFIEAGFETTSTTLSNIMYELAHNPDIQERLYVELREAKEKFDGKDLDSLTLADLTYLNCVITEVLRKYPLAGFLDRVAKEDYKIDEKLTIKKGTTVFTCLGGLQLDPKYWPEPKKFDPERFLPENKHKITPYTFMPFGEGPRNCIGRRPARQAINYCVSYLILAFEVRPIPGTPSPDEITLSWKSTISMPADDLYIKFIPRV